MSLVSLLQEFRDFDAGQTDLLMQIRGSHCSFINKVVLFFPQLLHGVSKAPSHNSITRIQWICNRPHGTMAVARWNQILLESEITVVQICLHLKGNEQSLPATVVAQGKSKSVLCLTLPYPLMLALK